VQYTSSNLLLPISTATTVLTILLPLFAAANIIFTPILGRYLLTKPPALQQFLLPALHILQGGVAIVIATLAAQGLTPGCELETTWQEFWHTHNFHAIERIQNSLDCCGYRSIVDRTWPKTSCSEIYGRNTHCNAPWRASMQRTSALQFAVAAIAGLIQVSFPSPSPFPSLHRRN
jgi:hypothetical protein